MSEKNEPKSVYLAQLGVFGYELTVVAETKEEAVKAMRKEYLKNRAIYGAPVNNHGALESFPRYAEYAGMTVMKMEFDSVEWL